MLKKKSANKSEDFHKARALRRESSPFEGKVWELLRLNSKPSGLKFRRQQPVHPYIADFACLEVKLLIEIDGPSHIKTHEQDIKRERYLRDKGFDFLRFSNDDVRENAQAVVDTILARTLEKLNKKTKI